MRLALAEARAALTHDDVPVGAVIVDASGKVVARGHNQRELSGDPTAHAEMVSLRKAAAIPLASWRLSDCTMVVTLEPCVMCAGGIIAARLGRLVFGAWDTKAGACGSVWDLVRDSANLHTVEVIPGVLERESAALLGEFFAARRSTL